jgi:hypothetical protein
VSPGAKDTVGKLASFSEVAAKIAHDQNAATELQQARARYKKTCSKIAGNASKLAKAAAKL